MVIATRHSLKGGTAMAGKEKGSSLKRVRCLLVFVDSK